MNADQYHTDEKVHKYENYTDRCLMRQYILKPSFQKIYDKSLKNKRVIDFACGYGNSTEWLIDLEPEELIGVDLSPAMIDAIKKRFSSHPNYSKFKFLVHDGSQPLNLGQFDVVQSSFFLSHAESKEQLTKMVKIMADSTRKGGVCLGLMTSPHFKKEKFSKMFKYHIEFRDNDSGNKYMHTVRFHDGPVGEGKFLCEVEQFTYETEFYEKAFLQAGFDQFEWINPSLFSKTMNDYFKDYFEANPYIIFKAIKA